MNWITSSHNAPFTIALTITVCFAAIEGIGMLLGLAASQSIENAIGLDVNADGDGLSDGPDQGGWLAGFLHWFGVGHLPLLISLNVLLSGFAIAGYVLQESVISFFGNPLPVWLAGTLALLAALPVWKLGNAVAGKCWPKDESSAVNPADWIGRSGTVTTGTATQERAAEVKIHAADGSTHYLMVYSMGRDIPAGSAVLVIERKEGSPFYRGLPEEAPFLSN